MKIAANERKLTRIKRSSFSHDLTEMYLRSSAFICGNSSPRLRVSAVH